MKNFCLLLLMTVFGFTPKQETNEWICINQLGYQPSSVKVAVWCSKSKEGISNWELVDASTNTTVYKGSAEKLFGVYGPFLQTARLNFTNVCHNYCRN
ncbi:MAG: hypothetical protein K2X48_08365 [Chitinophagaceae bacterium]|nr:hypothetical protein [Chitinophagaceae bacterium]